MIPLGFTAPLILGALVLLPVIWWLLRLTPPKPQQVAFPPTRILMRIVKHEETPSKSPWWLTLLRLLMAAAVILALAGPVLRPIAPAATGAGPIYLIIDNGWGSAPTWEARFETANRIVARAGEDGRPIAVIGTADGPAQALEPGSPDQARTRLAALASRPFPAARSALVTPLRRVMQANPAGEIVFISDGVRYADGEAFIAFLQEIQGAAALTVYRDEGLLPLAIKGTQNAADALGVNVTRAESDVARPALVRAFDQRGRVIGESEITFARAEADVTARFVMPVELRNEVARIEIADMATAAAVHLVDDRFRRRVVGLLSGSTADQDQPLLSPLHYISRALQPFADVREPRSPDVVRGVPELTRSNVSVIISADVGTFGTETERVLRDWMARGGVLIRFAGQRLANTTDDPLLPVRIRQGGRTLGGTLSWQQPQGLGAFPANGPFTGMPTPGDVTVTRQVLAEPDGDLAARTWASLTDGTPLVTGQRVGSGFLVLVHVTADTSWSNLPLSGSFVEMLRRIVAVSQSMAATPEGADAPTERVLLPPLRVLDGKGRIEAPGPDVKPLDQAVGRSTPVSSEHPAGLYGTEDAFVALNVLGPNDQVVRLDLAPLTRATVTGLVIAAPISLKPWLLTGALIMMILDILAVLWLGGRLRLARAAAVVAGLAVFGAIGLHADRAMAQQAPAGPSAAAPIPKFDRDAALSNSLAYVVTGDPDLDETSRRGLAGLTQILSDRTALEPGAPVGVNIARDELAFFPLLYWPISTSQPTPSAQVMARIDAFMKNGGTVLFDTRDQLTTAPRGFGRTSGANAKLREILASLDVPALEPAPTDHVVSRAFYLLEEFPGRYAGGQMWVEALPPADPNSGRPVRAGDGVSPVIITSNDLAGAWAINERGEYLFATVPPEARQREMAYRVGVNIVMYAYTGNYKADQVHVPALLERLGQ